MIKLIGYNFKNLLKNVELYIEIRDNIFESPNIFYNKPHLLKDTTIRVKNRHSKGSSIYITNILINTNRFSIRTLKGKIMFSLSSTLIECV
jgi:hypothetical protein